VSYLLSPDVTDPLAQLVIVDPANGAVVDTKAGGLEFDSIETDNGVSRLRLHDGRQLEQYPGIHGGFSLMEGSGAYGRCLVDGCLVAFKSRPEDPAYVYTIKRLP
jgi:hypothetical protein